MRHATGNQTYRTIVMTWLTLSLASVVLAAVTWHQLSKKLAQTRQAVAIRTEVDSVLKLLLEAETSQRGFTITGNGEFLEPMVNHERELAKRFDALTGLVRDDPNMLEKVINLHGQAEVLLNHHHHIIKVRKDEGETAAKEIIRKREGKQVMDGIRAIVDDLLAKLEISINDDPNKPSADLFRASLTSLLAGILGIGAGVLAFRLSVLSLRHEVREKELIEAKLNAERSSQEKTVFLANMSHEIRTPMNAILGFCELLQNELQEPKHRQYLNAIAASGRSLLQLINDILDMSKIEAGVLELKQDPTDPREICQFIKTVFVEAAARKNVKLDCLVAEDLPRSLLMDRIRLRQILLNLVGNAVKFTDQGEVIVRVDWEKEKRSSHITLLIEVQDTGVGIPEDKLEQVFHPFVQAGADREKEKQGTGLGLSIVKRMTEMMGGAVTAASIVGKGSAFSLRFPNVPISSRLASNERLEAGGPTDFNRLDPAKVLVVDDNEANCQLIGGMFFESHHELHFARDGAQAVELAERIHPQVILMDVRMPGMGGREALENIRKLPGFELTPIIAVTASSLLSEEEDLKRMFSGYVRKPFTQRELFEELAQFIPRREASSGSPAFPEPGATTTHPPVSPELITELRRLAAERWLGLQEALAINECKDFAGHLVKLAEQYHCAPLTHYANKLLQEAAAYNVTELELKLKEFPSILERLAQHIHP